MKKSLFFLRIPFLSALLVSMLLFNTSQAQELIIEIDIAPATLNLDNAGSWVTVHTDIAYGLVDGATVELNGEPISWWKSDNQGNFVAKFNIGDIQGLFEGKVGSTTETLILTGQKKDGTSFEGSQEITVIKIAPPGKK